MKKFLDKFLSRPILHQLGMFLAVCAFLYYIFNQFIYSAPYQENVSLTEKIEDLESKIVKERSLAKNLAKYKEEVRSLDRKLNLVLEELPDEKQIPAFLQSVADLAVETGLEVTKFEQLGEEIDEYFASVPVAIELRGTFHKLATFFDEVAHLDRIININDISVAITGNNNGEMEIFSKGVATTFRYLSDEESSANVDNDGPARTRRKK